MMATSNLHQPDGHNHPFTIQLINAARKCYVFQQYPGNISTAYTSWHSLITGTTLGGALIQAGAFIRQNMVVAVWDLGPTALVERTQKILTHVYTARVPFNFLHGVLGFERGPRMCFLTVPSSATHIC